MTQDNHDFFAAHAGAPPVWYQKDFKQLKSLELEVQWRWTYADAMVRAKSRFVLPEAGTPRPWTPVTAPVPVPVPPATAAGTGVSAVSGVTGVPPTPAAASPAPPARPTGAPPPSEELTLANPAFKKVEPAK